MKFRSVRFRESQRLEIPNLPRPNDFSLTAQMGLELELDPTGSGILAHNPNRNETWWIPASAVAAAEVIVEAAVAKGGKGKAA